VCPGVSDLLNQCDPSEEGGGGEGGGGEGGGGGHLNRLNSLMYLGDSFGGDSFDADIFTDDALRLGLDPLELDELQMLSDPSIVTDPATEDSFRLDRL